MGQDNVWTEDELIEWFPAASVGGGDVTQDDWKMLFTELLKSGNLTVALARANINKDTFHSLKYKIPKLNAKYKLYRKMVAENVLEPEAYRRAIQGVEKPIYYRGEEVGTVTEYSDSLLIRLLQGAMPEVYRDHSTVETITKNDKALDLSSERLKDLSTEELEVLEKILKKIGGDGE